jgi:hypothetical protein
VFAGKLPSASEEVVADDARLVEIPELKVRISEESRVELYS